MSADIIASQELPPMVEVLLELGAGVNTPDSNGWTSLHLAAAYGYAASVRRLLRAGADASSTTRQGLTPADIADRNGHGELADMLRRAAGPPADQKVINDS